MAGKRLFIWPEQGFGDQIFAARYVPQIAADVTLVCLPALVRLFEQLPARIIPRRDPVAVGSDYDFWTLPLSLPQWTSPASTPYLRAEAKGRGRVGVMWRGNAVPDPGRSLPEHLAARLLAIPGAISLQPEDTGAADFRATAEIIAGLDLVISIDTSVAHLSGALGVRGIVLLQHHQTDWRWREAAPGISGWYPSLRLLRQQAPGDWEGVVEGAISLARAE